MKSATKGQIQTMIGILALGDQASGGNIRTLHYRWLSSEVSPSGVYYQARRLIELGWIKKTDKPCLMIAWEHTRHTPVYRLTEAGYRSLVRSFADMLWLGHVNASEYRKVSTAAEKLLNETVERVKQRVAA